MVLGLEIVNKILKSNNLNETIKQYFHLLLLVLSKVFKAKLDIFISCFKTGHCCECQAKSTKCMKYKGLKSLLPLSFFLACKTGSWSSPGCRKRHTV